MNSVLVASGLFSEDMLAGILFLAVGILGACAAVMAGAHALRLRRTDGCGPNSRLPASLATWALGTAALALWFAFARFHGRPPWTMDTGLPYVARLFIGIGLVGVLQYYWPRRVLFRAALCALGGLVCVLIIW